MKKNSSTLLLFCGLFSGILCTSQASAAELVILGGPSLSYPSFSQASVGGNTITNSASASGVGFTLGALIRLPFSPDFQLETGLTYLQRNYSLSVLGSSSYSFDESLKGIHIPLLVRARIIDSLSVGLGGYLFRGVGDVADNNVSVSGQSLPNQENSYDAVQYNRNDFGLEGSIAYDLPLLPQYGNEYCATVDIRYLLGLTNLGSGSTTSIQSRDFLFMAGFKINFTTPDTHHKTP